VRSRLARLSPVAERPADRAADTKCFPQAVDRTIAVPGPLPSGLKPGIHKLFPPVSTNTPHVFPRLSTALSTGPYDLGHRPGLASQPGIPGSQAAVTSGEGGDRPAREPAASGRAGSPRGAHTPPAVIAPRRASRPSIPPADSFRGRCPRAGPREPFPPGILAHFRAVGTARIPGPRHRQNRGCRHSRPRLRVVNQPECQSAASRWIS